MSDLNYSGLTVGVKLDEFTGQYLLGAEVSGAFVPFFRLSQSRLEKYLARAAAQSQSQQSEQPSQPGNPPEQPDVPQGQ